MVEFSASEAAFTGFRVVREHPLAAAIWAILQFAVSAGLGCFLILTCGPAMNRFVELQASGALAVDPQRIYGLASQLTPLYAAGLAALVFYSVLIAAMNRAVLHPGRGRFGYVRLGADELRQFVLVLLFIALAAAAYLVAGVVVAIALSAATGSAAALVAAVTVVGVVCAAVFLGVRLSLASADTFAGRRVALAGSWALTRGRFWPILGTYLLAMALAALVWSLVLALTTAAAAVVGGSVEAVEALMRADMSSPAAYFSPARLVVLALTSISWALVLPLLLTPGARIYQRLGHPSGEPRTRQPGGDILV
ncbi:MAG: hypothetical protein JO127_02970 [Caulobacteraceae bacterium]|nr:hypothetical protein [Caulobacteraceae bacterium]